MLSGSWFRLCTQQCGIIAQTIHKPEQSEAGSLNALGKPLHFRRRIFMAFSPYVSDRAKRKGLYGPGPLSLSPCSVRNNVAVLSFFQNPLSEFVKFVCLRS